MAKVFKVVAVVAGVVAMVAGTISSFGIGGAAFAAIAGTVATVAGVVAGVASMASQLLTKPPPARGGVTQLMIAVDAPQPYAMGEGYFAGVLRYQHSYGATLDKVPNPYRFQAVVYSGGGPVDSLTPYVDIAPVGSYYSGFLYTTTALGACPDSALTPQWSGAPGWTSASKLSGKAAIGWSLKFDKNGKVFASGMPQTGAFGKWVKVYDPRLDSTFPGGSGSHRLNNEATWAWSENPALHAATYAYGRYQNGKRVMGIGLPADAIDWANVAAWANVCDANSWRLFGVVFEPGDRWANLRDICEAGGAEPVLTAAALSFHYNAPRVALDTIHESDVIQGPEHGVTAQASWRERLNTIVPKRLNSDQNWQLMPDAAVQVSSYVTEDGEVKQAEWPFNFVKDANQAAQMARYKLENSRELQGIDLVLGPRFFAYRPGDCLELDLLDFLGLTGPAVILRRELDAAALTVKLTLIGETSGKHAFALGQTGTPPATPALGQTGQDRDAVAGAVTVTPARGAYLFLAKSPTYPLSSTDTTITVAALTGTLDDGSAYSESGATITGLPADTLYTVFWDIAGAAYIAVVSPAAGYAADSNYVVIGAQATAVSGGGSYTPPGSPPGGYHPPEYL